MNKAIPLSVPSFQGNEKKYVLEAIDTEWVSTAGPYVKKFEEKIAGYLGAKYAIAACNGTSALHIALIEMGIGVGDEVIVPTITFISPINTVRYVGAHPVFIDCDDHLNIDVKKTEAFLDQECAFNGEFTVNKSTGKKIKAVMPVHVFGHPVDMEYLKQLAEKYNLEVIEDAAESLGSRYRKGKYKGKMTGTIGDIGCFSFNGNKIISSGGGGMIVTNDGEKAGHMKYLTTQAKNDELYYIHDEVGFNYRMTNLQAALGTAQLENLNYFIQIKRKNFEYYKNALNGYKGLTFIDDPDYAESNNWFYSLIVDNDEYGMTRDELLKKLREENIKVRPLWFLNHMQKPYKDHQAYKIEKALWYYHRVLNLPCSVNLTIDDIERVISVLKS